MATALEGGEGGEIDAGGGGEERIRTFRVGSQEPLIVALRDIHARYLHCPLSGPFCIYLLIY